jgi:hypothetical protein
VHKVIDLASDAEYKSNVLKNKVALFWDLRILQNQ